MSQKHSTGTPLPRLEKMSDFFEARLEGYDEHMLKNIASATEFYPFTAAQLPKAPGCRVLDLGCGTGLELEAYFKENPTALVTGIDLSAGMLAALSQKFKNKAVTLINASYFDVPLGVCTYDAAVSVESLHHFTKAQKTALYQKLHRALVPNGYFILTDYFAATNEEEAAHQKALFDLKAALGITDDAFYHYDTPLTVAHECEALQAAGFREVAVLATYGATAVLKASK